MDAATVVWVAPSGSSLQAGASERSSQADQALEEWGRSRGLRLGPPSEEATPSLHVDEALADRVEEDLEQARDASSALDVDAAERSLARAENTLRRHPELPQGAWLMAEVERGWARRWASVPPKDPDRAAAAWQRARGLDGGRERGVGEGGVGEGGALGPVLPDVSFELLVDGDGDARLDGRPAASGTLRTTPGEHQLTVSRKGALVWAGWIGVGERAVVRVAPPDSPPCSMEDLGRVSVEGTRVRATGVRCERWVVAEPEGAGGSLLVALCRMDHCSALLEWRVLGAGPLGPNGSVGSTWPRWATWTLIGVGAAAIAGVTIGIDAAFHSSAPPPFTEGGCVCPSSKSLGVVGAAVKKR